MHPAYTLQWLQGDKWQDIGWQANTPESLADLRIHAAALADCGGLYRLCRVSLITGDLQVVETWGVVAA